MITVKIMGGLGNQMLQYATARRLAHVNSAELALDLQWFKGGHRKYELDAFNIVGREVTGAQPGQMYYQEGNYHFHPAVLELKGDVYLEGHWLNEKYFGDIAQIIRREFTFKAPAPPDRCRDTYVSILKTNSVAVHLRRGDLVTNQWYITIPMEYYRTAASMIAQRISDPVFFVFSDDISWCRKNLKLGYPAFFVDHNPPDRGVEDLRLISLCDHQITANSSMSWWAAWLNTNSEKVVFAPKQWVHDDLMGEERLPEEWIRL